MHDLDALSFELVANIWPIADATTGLIQRVAARGYAVPAGNDSLISTVLTGLAPTDFVLAKQYPIPKRFQFVSEHGTIAGSIMPNDFNNNLEAILDPILEDLEKSRPTIVGVAMASGEPQLTSPDARFADDPYTIITYLLEDLSGNLTPQLPKP